MKFKQLILLITIFLIFPLTTNASCESEKEYFKTIADKFTASYEVDHTNKTVDIVFEYPEKDKYIFYFAGDNLECKIKNDKLKCPITTPGIHKINLALKSETTCLISSIEIEVPIYNKYQDDDLCFGLEDFYLCQETLDEDIDYETFTSRIKSYIKKQNEKEVIITTEEENELLEYLNNNKVTIIVSTIFIILVIITIILTIKSQHDRRVLK